MNGKTKPTVFRSYNASLGTKVVKHAIQHASPVKQEAALFIIDVTFVKPLILNAFLSMQFVTVLPLTFCMD